MGERHENNLCSFVTLPFWLRHVREKDHGKLRATPREWALGLRSVLSSLWWLPFVVLFFAHAPGEYWKSQWSLGLLVAAVCFTLVAWSKHGWPLAACIFWTIVSGVWAMEYAGYPPLFYSMKRLVSVEGTVGYSLFAFLSMVGAGLFLTDKAIKLGRKLIPIFCLAASVQIIAQAVLGCRGHSISGFCNQAGMSGCLIATTIPFVWIDYRRWVVIPLIAIAILGTIGLASMPVFVLFIVGFAALLLRSRHQNLLCGLGLVLFLVGSAATVANPHFFDSSGRLTMYELTFKWWGRNANQVIGAGHGMFWVIGPLLQEQHNFMVDHWWGWLHSDWSQLLFEQGWIGLVLCGSLVIQCFYRAFQSKNTALFSSLAGYNAMALFNYPTHIAAHAFLGVFLVVLALRR